MKKLIVISKMYIRLLAVLLSVLSSFVVNAGINYKPITPSILYFDDNFKKRLVLPYVEDKKRINLPIGFKFALNISNTNFNKGYPKPAIPLESSWKTGFSGGAFLEIPIISRFSLQHEYLYSYLISGIRNEETEYYLGYISLPILLKWKIKPCFSVVAGPQVDVLIQAKQRFNGQISNIIHEVEERQIGVAAGAIYKLNKMLSIEARFVHGINHVGMRQTGTTREFKLEQFQVGALITVL